MKRREINERNNASSDQEQDLYENIVGKVVMYTTYFYNNHNYFFKIIRQTAKTAFAIRLKTKIISGDGHVGSEIPIDVNIDDMDFNEIKRLKKTFDPKYPFIMKGKIIYYWDGKPQQYDYTY